MVTTLPTSQTIPLDRKKIFKKTIVACWRFMWLVLVLVITFFFAILLPLSLEEGISPGKFAGWFILGIIGLEVVVGILAWLYQTAYFKRYYYNLEKDVLVIKKGVFTPRETTLPYRKINDVYVDMDLFDRVLGLRDVHVATASEVSAPLAHIDGVNPENAEKLKQLILAKIKRR